MDHSAVQVLGELDEDERMYVTERFHQEIVPKLEKLHARVGVLSCEFAGEPYARWAIRFRSSGSGFVIEDFEYDETVAGLDLDL